MNLVVGATGMVGGEICRLLREAGKPVRAMVRPTADPAKVQRLKSLGVTVVHGNLRDRASLKAACQGTRTVIVTASSLPFNYTPGENTPSLTDRDGMLDLVAAAWSAEVGRFVYTSFPPMSAANPLQDAKRLVEARLRNNGLNYTILQPTLFSEVWLSPAVGFDYPNHKATIYGDGENPISYISYLDVACFAALSLENPAAHNATLELGGPQALSQLQAVRIFEQAGGKPFEVTHVPVEALQAQYDAAQDEYQKSFAGLLLSIPSVRPVDMRQTAADFHLKLRTVEDYARSVMRPA